MPIQPLITPASQFGFFGKIPSVGDFVSRGLDAATVGRLDLWLSELLAGCQEQYPGLLSRWDTLPVVRFVLSGDVLSEQVYAGVLGPSQDSVGRIFPLVILYRLDCMQDKAVLLDYSHDWYSDMEDLIYISRNQAVEPDRLFQIIGRTQPEIDEPAAVGDETPAVMGREPAIEKAKSFWWTASAPILISPVSDALPRAAVLAPLYKGLPGQC